MNPGDSFHSSASSSDAFDELAALFLTETESSSRPRRARLRHAPAMRELLIVGNLPVRSGVWLAPYADAVARVQGPVGLVRLDVVPPILELLQEDEQSKCDAGSCRRLKDAIEMASDQVGTWIVRGPLHGTPAEYATHGFDRITILTSADSAAVVAAYQIIKDLAQTVSFDDEGEAAELPPIALAVVGSGQDAAEKVVERINETAQAQLGFTVSLSVCLPRMDAGIRSTTFASFGESEAPTVEELFEWINTAEAIRGLRSSNQSHKKDAPRLRLAPLTDDVESDTDEGLRPEPETDAARVEQHGPSVIADVPERSPEIETLPRTQEQQADREPTFPAARRALQSDGTVRLAPKPSKAAPQARATAAATSDGVSLASFINLLPLPLRCPGHDRVELASDHQGGVHVLAREADLRDLRIVENWVKAHRSLLTMACADRSLKPDAPVSCHVFTDEPATLADLHGTGLRLHVLAPVTVDGRTTWYTAPLSR